MSTTQPSEPPAGPSISEGAELHLFACGHGDTLLLRLPGARWALIDCHLPSESACKRFFQFLENRGVGRLHLLILTHAHYDHYAGMSHVVDHFTSGGRELEYFCDAALNCVHVLKMLEAKGRPHNELKEYANLITRVNEKGIRRRRLEEARCPIRFDGRNAQLIPIAPEESLVITTTEQVLQGQTPTASANDLSVVIVAQLHIHQTFYRALFPADSSTPQLMRALKIWSEHDENSEGSVQFDVVKVPHHGSSNGHWPDLCTKCTSKRSRVAAISVGERYRLPKRVVISDYQRRGWTVVATTTRHAPQKPNRLIEQFARRGSSEPECSTHDIVISCNETGLAWTPLDAEISETDVLNYAD